LTSFIIKNMSRMTK